MGSLKMNPNFEREMNKLVKSTLGDLAADYQKMFDRLSAQHKGRPIAQVKSVLQREWAKLGGKISDPELTGYAQAISDGTKIQIKV